MKGLLAPFHVLSPTPCLMRFPLALACLHRYLDHMTFPLAGRGHHSRGVVAVPHSAADRFDPAWVLGRRSEAVFVSCTGVGSAFQRVVGHRTSGAHKGMAAAYALGAQRQQRQLRALHVLFPLWLGGAHDGVHCSGSGQRQARGTTTTAHLHFLHRCILGVVRTSLRVVTWSVWSRR